MPNNIGFGEQNHENLKLFGRINFKQLSRINTANIRLLFK